MIWLFRHCRILSYVYLLFISGRSILPEIERNSSSSCFAIRDTAHWMKATCSSDEEIALKDATVSVYPNSQNCTDGNINNVFNECCTQPSNCSFNLIFDIKTADKTSGTVNEQCNGKQECLITATQITNSICVGPTYSANYMHLNFFCISGKYILINNPKTSEKKSSKGLYLIFITTEVTPLVTSVTSS